MAAVSQSPDEEALTGAGWPGSTSTETDRDTAAHTDTDTAPAPAPAPAPVPVPVLAVPAARTSTTKLAPRAGRQRRVKGTGTLRQLPSGRWQAAVHYHDHYVTAGVTFDTKLDASAWLTAANTAIAAGTFTPPTRSSPSAVPTVAMYAASWLATTDLRPRTIAHYQRLLEVYLLPDLGSVRLDVISPATVRTWYATLPTDRPTTRAHAYGLLRTIMSTAHADDLIAANPCRIRGAGSTRRASSTRIATVDELAALTAAMPPPWQAMIGLAAWCALRYGEITELRRTDLDLDTGVVHVRRAVVRVGGTTVIGAPKSVAGIRDVTIPPHLLPDLTHHLHRHVGPEPDALLFTAAGGGHLHQGAFIRAYYPARTAAGRPDLRFHDLRHTGATLAAGTGATLAELMARLGHSSPEAAMRYQHAAADRDRAIATALSDIADPHH